MLESINDVNLVAVIAATLAYFVLGAVWFTPLFGKQYDKAIGVDRSKKQKWPPIYYYGPFIGAVLTVSATAILISALKIENLSDAVALGLIVGIGYSAAVSFTNAITPNMPKPVLFGLITGSYHLAGVIVAALIIVSLS